MTPDLSPPTPTSRTSRRHFIAGAGALALSAGVAVVGRDLRTATASAHTGVAGFSAAPDTDPTSTILVVIQLTGGLDFLNTVVPMSGRYHDVRGAGALADEALLTLDRDFSLNANLPHLGAEWQAGRLAIVHGIGLPDNSLSHFTDTDIWARGRPETGDGTGWLGRSLHHVATDPDPMLGISIGEGLTPAMYAPGWSPVALPSDGRLPWSAEFIEENPGIVAAYQTLLGTPSTGGGMPTLADRVRSSHQLVRDIADTVGGATDLERLQNAAELFDEADGDDAEEAGALSGQLALVADLINGGLPTRAYHVVFGDFDTHADQEASFPGLLSELDTAIAGLRARLGANAERVVVATWTEFGRRPDWNGSGTDHGTAGTHFVVGDRVRGGHYGDPVSLTRFDDDSNFLVTGDFRNYLSGLVGGAFGVDPKRAIPGARKPIEVFS